MGSALLSLLVTAAAGELVAFGPGTLGADDVGVAVSELVEWLCLSGVSLESRFAFRAATGDVGLRDSATTSNKLRCTLAAEQP